ncbi:hypothetical protein WICPIJ_001109 [Wickerhamomyces pijperi]|uniref:Mannan endo-1,6-alpha-mannosidase n=1 Tax=Wickerhamomyces pijperi TaxID=599730 RepID=A0A9P8QC71_WICPI|nr:hypothetical protein WICPIJ_001109 [Wickerhamomyces pijperi]
MRLFKSQILTLLTAINFLTSTTNAIDLDITSKTSICNAASLIAGGILDYYEGTTYGGTVGMFSQPYYWWESGGAFGGLIDFQFFCDNDTYDEIIYNALMAQKGSGNNYIPANQSTTEGNDDQGFWGLTVMEATERNFTNPPSGEPGWLALSQAVFNTMWARWETDSCGGGLRWQIFTWNSGYSYKNTISTACLFAMATRLARYTGNETYIDVAETAFQWLTDIDFIGLSGDTYRVYDGAQIGTNCTEITQIQWSYNFALLMSGSAYAYNFTEDTVWLTRVNDLLNGASIFFENDIMYEQACQGTTKGCNTDQRSFKAYLSRSLGQTMKLVPSTQSTIQTYLETSAQAAADTCNGGRDGHTCGQNWLLKTYDNMYGLGEQMSALEVILSLLTEQSPAPYTNNTGGSSTGDASAGLSSIRGSSSLTGTDVTVTGKDKAGSGVITAIVLAVLTGGAVWMIV